MESNVIGKGKMPETIMYETSSGVLSLQLGVTSELISAFVGGENAVTVRFLDAEGNQLNGPAAFTKEFGSGAYNMQDRHYILDTDTLRVWESIKTVPAPWNLFGVLLSMDGKLRRAGSWTDIVKAQPDNYRELKPTYTHNLANDKYVPPLDSCGVLSMKPKAS